MTGSNSRLRVSVVASSAHCSYINNGIMQSNWFRGCPDSLYRVCKLCGEGEFHCD